MMANELFYYSGAAFFILLTFLILVVGIKLIMILATLQKAARSWRRFVDEAGVGIRTGLLKLLLRLF
ncbi:MAG: hypothetical protein PHR64_00120 [Candidatus Shapirobacteria bacterium]|nr:hypothetical protein [Candidatus Shapirobacteria bacterium]MDD5073591.1 hypothetical protein [Candidatus Shapirobacteria bacterium]MDD5481344.1 hypothetical protein [Candidatus Shapirobacteria bacterium]